MTQTNVAITQLLQVGMAERMAQEAQAHPEVVRLAAQQAAPEALRQQNAIVPQTEEAEGTRRIRSRGGGGGKGGPGGRRRQGKPPDPEGQEPGTENAAATPWAGNIVNIKV